MPLFSRNKKDSRSRVSKSIDQSMFGTHTSGIAFDVSDNTYTKKKSSTPTRRTAKTESRVVSPSAPVSASVSARPVQSEGLIAGQFGGQAQNSVQQNFSQQGFGQNNATQQNFGQTNVTQQGFDQQNFSQQNLTQQHFSQQHSFHISGSPTGSRMVGGTVPTGINDRKFSLKKKANNRGFVNQIDPYSSTRESSASHARRMNNRKNFERGEEIRSSRLRVVIIAATILVALLIAFTAARTVFTASVDSRLAYSAESGVEKALVAPGDASAYYVLLTANFNVPPVDEQKNASFFTPAPEAEDAISAMMLVRVDASDNSERNLTLVTMPGSIRLNSNGILMTASELYQTEGMGALVSSVSSLVGVGISHCVHIDAEGFKALIEEVGDVSLEVPQSAHDAEVSDITIQPGLQTLNPEECRVLLAASDYPSGTFTQMQVHQNFASKLAQMVFNSGMFSLGLNMDTFADHMKSDMTSKEIKELFDQLCEIDMSKMYLGTFEGYDSSTSAGDPLFVANATNVEAIMERVDAGEIPVIEEESYDNIDKESFEIIVRNGGGVEGAATKAADYLKNDGFQVKDIENAEVYAYEETLIVYLDPQYETAAKAIAKTLGAGRVINGVNYYAFDAEILLALGSDWNPNLSQGEATTSEAAESAE